MMHSKLKVFEDRVQVAYDTIARVPSAFRSGPFLDVGCGIGNGVIAALKHGASLAVGIDADLGEFAHDFVPEEIPDIFRHFKVDPARPLLFEADIFDLKFSPPPFRMVLMQDAVEHVPEPQRFIRYIHDILEPGGYFVLDSCPLYYSPQGHHLFHCFDGDTDPWPHLRPDFEERLREARTRGEITEWHLRNVGALNKVTHDELIAAFRSAGFTILEEERGREDPYKAELFRKYGHLIDPSLGIERQWLFEDRITVLARKAAASAGGATAPRGKRLASLRGRAKNLLAAFRPAPRGGSSAREHRKPNPAASTIESSLSPTAGPRSVPMDIGGKLFAMTSDDEYVGQHPHGFEPQLVALFRTLASGSDVTLDIGANIGCTALALAPLSRTVHAFEPSPTTFAFLKQNVSRSGLTNVAAHNIALGDKTEKSTLTFAPHNRSGGFVSNHTRASAGHTVEAIVIRPLDEVLGLSRSPPEIDLGQSKLDFIKIDVEGFEPAVLRGASRTLAAHQPVVLMELNHWCLNALQRTSVPDFFDLLRSIFPVLFAVDGLSALNLHDSSDSYTVMYNHINRGRFANIVAAFSRDRLAAFLGKHREPFVIGGP